MFPHEYRAPRAVLHGRLQPDWTRVLRHPQRVVWQPPGSVLQVGLLSKPENTFAEW